MTNQPIKVTNLCNLIYQCKELNFNSYHRNQLCKVLLLMGWKQLAKLSSLLNLKLMRWTRLQLLHFILLRNLPPKLRHKISIGHHNSHINLSNKTISLTTMEDIKILKLHIRIMVNLHNFTRPHMDKHLSTNNTPLKLKVSHFQNQSKNQ